MRDPLNRLYAVVLRRPQSAQKAKDLFNEHLDGLVDRCPEATEPSNFACPGRFNPNSYSKDTWDRYKMGGPWPGACLIYATLKDHYKTSFYAERAQNIAREYTIGRGEHWRWKDEDGILPTMGGIVRP